MNNERKEKFTPGPWCVCFDRDFEQFDICNDDTLDVVGHANDRADARLIAAAPAMYDLLDSLKDTLASVPLLQSEIENVLKKARGEE